MGKMKEKTIEEEKKQEELTTEVTSIAEEEKKTGEKIDVPEPEELVARASSAMVSDRKNFMNIFSQLGKKAKDRVTSAVLDLPTGGLPVKLRSKEEKAAYALGQRVINHRFTITFHHINEEIKAQKEAEKQEKENNNKGEENESVQKS